jgi:hypothetical protein
MPLTPYLKEGAFDPVAIEAMNAAFTAVCESLQLSKRDDPLTAIVARTVVHIGRTGERDPARIHQLAMLILKESSERGA